MRIFDHIFVRGQESTVEWFFNDMEMTYNWKRRWARWEVFWSSSSCFEDELESNKKAEKSETQI